MIGRSKKSREPGSEPTQADPMPEDAAASSEDDPESMGDEGGEAALSAEAEALAGTMVEAAAEEEAEALRAELQDLQDRYLRLAAEFENYRKRTRREQAELGLIAQAALVRRLLPTLDDLARVAATPHESTTVEALDKGIELILKNLRKELEDAGLEAVESAEARFDPEQHQALLVTEVSDPEADETISQVFVEGYRFRDRLIRPAQVEVRRFTGEEEATTSSGIAESGTEAGPQSDACSARDPAEQADLPND